MRKKTKETFRRFLKLRNVVPFFIIVVAFMATFFTTPFGLQRDQILLALLAFLAIDAIIERTEILTYIESDVETIKELITSQTTGKDFFRFRKDFPRIEHLIAEAEQEIWVSGIVLVTMVPLSGIFNSKLKQGFKLRFLMVNPAENNTLQDTGIYFGEDPDDIAAKITASLNDLYRKLVKTYPEQVEIRLTDHRPNLGYFIVDPHRKQGYMTVEPYLYRTESSQRPMFLLSQEDSRWFSVYLADFELLWSKAQTWPSTPP